MTYARHAPEADLVVNMLQQEGIPAFHRRTLGLDVPDFLAIGARVVLVPADRVEHAKQLLDPFEWRPAPGEDPPEPV